MVVYNKVETFTLQKIAKTHKWKKQNTRNNPHKRTPDYISKKPTKNFVIMNETVVFFHVLSTHAYLKTLVKALK